MTLDNGHVMLKSFKNLNAKLFFIFILANITNKCFKINMIKAKQSENKQMVSCIKILEVCE